MFPLTYLEFHALFLLPPLIGLSAVARRRDADSGVRPLAVSIVTVLALAYTTPWDNYLIRRGVWWYGDGRVVARVFLAPVEEYLFILAVPILTALWLEQISTFRRRDLEISLRQRAFGVVAGLAVGAVGVGALLQARTLYLGAILAWAAPVLALQWGVGWPYLVARWRTLATGVAAPTAYFWVADVIALRNGIWVLSPDLTTGVAPFGLPVEEALFFLVTTLFVVQGLLLYPWVIDRWG